MMKTENKALNLLSWIHTFLILEGVYYVALGFLRLNQRQAAIFTAKGLLLFIPIILSFVCIRKVSNLWLFLLAGAAVTAAMTLVSGSILTGCLTVFIFLVRCYVRIRKGRIKRMLRDMPGGEGVRDEPELWEIPTFFDEPRPAYFIIFLIYYAITLMSGRHQYLRPVFWLLFGEIIVCFASCYLEAFQDFIRKNQKIANLPVRTMKRVGRIIFLLGGVGLLLFMLPGVIYNDEPLTRVKLEMHPIMMDELMPQEQESGGQSMQEMLESLGIAKHREMPQWVKYIGNLFIAAMLAGLAYLALKSILKTLMSALDSFSQEEEDEIISLKEADESIFVRASTGIRRQREQWLSPNMRIRRKYKKTIQKGLKEAPWGSETPKELEEKAGISGEEKQTLHTIYEKARYSKEGCTKEEAKSL